MKVMQRVFYSMAAIAVATIAQPVQAIEEGLYWGGGSRYITIARRVTKEFGDRVCFSGFSPNGSMIASLSLKIPRYQTGIDYEVYTLDGAKSNLAIQQYAFKRDQITFGKLVGRFVREGLVYKYEGDTRSMKSPELQDCLNSAQPYFKQIPSGRDRR
jgi:hypothetical protein